MKKIFSIIFIMFFVCQSLFSPLSVNAAIETYNLIAIKDNDYTVFMRILNNKVFNGEFYSGYSLSDYDISGYAYYKGNKYSTIKWANENYIIINGKQTVEISLPDIYGDGVNTLSIEIEGKPTSTYKKEVFGDVGYEGQIFTAYTGFTATEALPKVKFFGDGKELTGTFSVLNWNSSQVGIYEFQWTFIPNDSSYETRTGIVKVKFLQGYTPEDAQKDLLFTETPTVPSLTVTSVLLTDINAQYDININDKVDGSSYKWNSSDPEVVFVNERSGLIKAKKEGKAIITCEITYPDFTTQTLTSVVIVGYDENSPVLSEDELELVVGDKFTISVENLVKGSKVSWKSSNKNIVKVSSTKGKVTAVGTGEAYVTCTITTPDKQVIVLRTDIIVTEIE